MTKKLSDSVLEMYKEADADPKEFIKDMLTLAALGMGLLKMSEVCITYDDDKSKGTFVLEDNGENI